MLSPARQLIREAARRRMRFQIHHGSEGTTVCLLSPKFTPVTETRPILDRAVQIKWQISMHVVGECERGDRFLASLRRRIEGLEETEKP